MMSPFEFRLKDKMQSDSNLNKNQPSSGSRKIQEEMKELREAFVINFNEQMKLKRIVRRERPVRSLCELRAMMRKENSERAGEN